MKLRKRLRARCSFTLVELLVSMAITILIVAFLGRVLIATTSIWQRSGEHIDAFRDARSAMQLMTNDLSRAHVNGDPKMLNLANVSGSGYATEAYAVFPNKNSGHGDLCAVGYYLDWDGSSKTFSLRRFFKDNNTVAPSLAKSAVDFGTLYDRTTSTTPETLASYVWDLELRPGEGQNTVAPTADPSTKWNWIEIRFKAMSVNAGRKIGVITAIDKTTWSDPSQAAYRTFILPNEQQFVTRVMILQNQ